MKTREEKLAYIAAFIDGEGHIGNHLCAQGNRVRSIAFCNTDKGLIDFMIKILNECDFPTRTTYNKPLREDWSPRWTVYIAGGEKSFRLFSETVPIQSFKKRRALLEGLSEYERVRDFRRSKKLAKLMSCQVCGESFPSCRSWKARGHGRFCSVTCRGLSQRKRIAKVCVMCRKNYETIPARSSSKFCSKSCHGKSKSERMASLASVAAAARWKDHKGRENAQSK